RRRGLLISGAGTAAVAVGFVLTGGGGSQPRPHPVSVVTTWSPAPPLPSTVATSPAPAASPDQPADVALEPPPEAPPPGPGALPALTAAQAADPEAVAARFLVTYATFHAGEDPAAADARLAELATPSLAEELQRDSSASAALEDLRARNVAFAGQVVEISTSERSGSRATVVAVVEHTTVVDGVVDPDFRLVPYTVTLVPSGPGWLVAGLTS
ncbi:MAG: hypothetical protein KY450_06935, partial [Actinobacteria bacterium]|nr:hypothetical protein [Actinomycetota bacterium]